MMISKEESIREVETQGSNFSLFSTYGSADRSHSHLRFLIMNFSSVKSLDNWQYMQFKGGTPGTSLLCCSPPKISWAGHLAKMLLIILFSIGYVRKSTAFLFHRDAFLYLAFFSCRAHERNNCKAVVGWRCYWRNKTTAFALSNTITTLAVSGFWRPVNWRCCLKRMSKWRRERDWLLPLQTIWLSWFLPVNMVPIAHLGDNDPESSCRIWISLHFRSWILCFFRCWVRCWILNIFLAN